MICGELWPDAPAPDGRPVTCHLPDGHGGLWHRWDHENHVKPGEDFADGMIAWHTEVAKKLAVGIGPTVRETGASDLTHEVVHHPTHVMLHNNLPDKP